VNYQKNSVQFVTKISSGEKNGGKIGRRSSIVQKNVLLQKLFLEKSDS
tara:strand:+ start:329 stop:472 length:144 start_codon:yes stop_codon:yes gene_type:complete